MENHSPKTFTMKDSSLVVKEMQFMINEETQQIIGMLICTNKKPFAFPDKQIFEVEQLATKILIVKFEQNAYLQAVRAWKHDDYICSLAFLFCDKESHKVLDMQVIGSSSEGDVMQESKATPSNHLNIFEITHTSYLKEFACEQVQLDSFKPQALIQRVIDKTENYALNYLDLKILKNLIPADSFVKDPKFKELYNSLRDAIDTIERTKKLISDRLEENSFFMEQLEDTFKQIAKSVGPSLKKGHGKFRAVEFPREKQKLEDLENLHSQCLRNSVQMDPKVSALREDCNTITKLKANLFSEQQVKQTLVLYSGRDSSSLQSLAENAFEQELRHLQKIKQKHNQITETLNILSTKREDCQKIFTDLQNQMTELSSTRAQATTQDLSKLSLSTQNFGEQEVDEMNRDFTLKMKKMSESFQQKKGILDQLIEEERKKMSSDVTNQTNTQTKGKANHFIFILDESGSMYGNWQSLTDTFTKFIETFKNDDSVKHNFSTILFDNGARILYKRLKANDIQPLPALQGGGTTFSTGFMLAEQLVSMTPQELTPVIIFMTDGGCGSSDTPKSIQILQTMHSSAKQKGQMFFAIGFGTGYNKQVLQQLADAANGNVQQLTVGSTTYSTVLEAVDYQELHTIFVGLSSTFEKSAQESAIDALTRQSELDHTTFNKDLEFHSQQHKKHLEDIQKMMTFKLEMKRLQQEGQSKQLEDYISNKIKLLELEIQNATAEQQIVIDNQATLKAEAEKLDKDIQFQEENVKSAEKRGLENKQMTESNQVDKTNSLNELIRNSQLQDLDGIKTLFTQLGAVEGTVESLIQAAKNSKNLLVILGGKIKDMLSQFEGTLEKTLLKNLKDDEIGLKIIKIMSLDESYNNKSASEILMAALQKNSEQNFNEYKKFYEKLLEWIDLSAIATCRKKKLPKYAKQYAAKLTPKEEKELNSDSESGSGSEKSASSDEEDGKKVSISEISNDEIDGFKPIFKKEVEKKYKVLQDKMKNLRKDKAQMLPKKYKEKKQKLADERAYYKILLNETVLIETLEKCLKNIVGILSKAVGADITKRIFQDFSTIFEFFSEHVEKKMLPYRETVKILGLENERELKGAIQEMQDKKYILTIQASNELQASNSQATGQRMQSSLAQIEY